MRRVKRLSPTCYPPPKRRRRGRCVLCVDPMQLPPTVLSAAGVEAGLASSPMERRSRSATRASTLRFLDEQRRMHPAISAFPNATYYGGRVRDAPHSTRSTAPGLAALFHYKKRSAGCRTVVDVTHGKAMHDGPSLRNDAEVDAIAAILSTLFQRLPVRAPVDVAVISFYKAQIQSLERALAPTKQRLGLGAGQSLRIGTVDAFRLRGRRGYNLRGAPGRAPTRVRGRRAAIERAPHRARHVCSSSATRRRRAATSRSTAGASSRRSTSAR